MDRDLIIPKLVFGSLWYLSAIFFHEKFIYNNWKHYKKTARSVASVSNLFQNMQNKNDFFLVKLRLNNLIKEYKQLKWNRVSLLLVRIANMFFLSTTFKIFPIENIIKNNPTIEYENLKVEDDAFGYLQRAYYFILKELALFLGVIFAVIMNKLRDPKRRKKFYLAVAFILLYSVIHSFILGFFSQELAQYDSKINFSSPDTYPEECPIQENLSNITNETISVLNQSLILNESSENITQKSDNLVTSIINYYQGILVQREHILQYTVFSMITLVVIFVFHFFFPAITEVVTGMIVLIVMIEFCRFCVNLLYKGAGDTLLGLFIGIMVETILNRS